MTDLTDAIVRLERIQNDLRALILYPTLCEGPEAEEQLHTLIHQITLLDLHVQRWIRPRATHDDQERRHRPDRRQQARRHFEQSVSA
jgi:hypothetical protein